MRQEICGTRAFKDIVQSVEVFDKNAGGTVVEFLHFRIMNRTQRIGWVMAERLDPAKADELFNLIVPR
jgi:hypothetical protein